MMEALGCLPAKISAARGLLKILFGQRITRGICDALPEQFSRRPAKGGGLCNIILLIGVDYLRSVSWSALEEPKSPGIPRCSKSLEGDRFTR